MLRLAGLNCKLALRTPWILRMLCSCLCSDPKMRLDTWENTVLIYSTVIQADHQPAVKSCWKVLKLGNNIGSRAKPTVLFLRLGALFQNYCLVYSYSLVFKRDPFNTKNYHNLESIIFIFIFFQVINHKVPMNWCTSCYHGVCHHFFHPHKYFVLFSPWNLEDLGFSLSQDSYHWPVHQTTSSELQPQNKHTTYQTKGTLYKSQTHLAASSPHTIIPRANYKSFALDKSCYLTSVKTSYYNNFSKTISC